MANTPLGFPLVALTDSADVATKLNAISTALDSYLTGTAWVNCPAASSAFVSSLQVMKWGPLCIFAGTVSKASGNYSGSAVVASLPSVSYAPKSLARGTLYGYVTGAPSAAQMAVEVAPGSTDITLSYLGVGTFSAAYFAGFMYPHQ